MNPNDGPLRPSLLDLKLSPAKTFSQTEILTKKSLEKDIHEKWIEKKEELCFTLSAVRWEMTFRKDFLEKAEKI